MNTSQWTFATSITVGIVWFLFATWPLLQRRAKGKKLLCTDQKLQTWLVRQLSDAKKSILIAGDDLSEKIYGSGFAAALLDKLKSNKQIEVRILVGQNDKSALRRELSADHYIDYRFLVKPIIQNFCVIDEMHLVVETPHVASYKNWEVYIGENCLLKGWLWTKKFNELWVESITLAHPRRSY